MNKQTIGTVLCVFIIFLGIGLTGLFIVGNFLISAENHRVSSPPNDLPVVSVSIMQTDKRMISGWFVLGEKDMPGILLLHSVRSDRTEMLGRAIFLHKAGYSVLLIDMQGHGETLGDNITFGVRESRDAHTALHFLKKKMAGRKVGVIGVSLGGAASLLGETPLAADAVILESVYSSIESAVENRVVIRLGAVGKYLAPFLIWQIEPILGIPLEAMTPLNAIKRLNAPVFIIAGADDQHTLKTESLALFHSASNPKSIWLIEGAKHQNLHRYNSSEYEVNVLKFLNTYLLD